VSPKNRGVKVTVSTINRCFGDPLLTREQLSDPFPTAKGIGRCNRAVEDAAREAMERATF
jgi:hypothetical protein